MIRGHLARLTFVEQGTGILSQFDRLILWTQLPGMFWHVGCVAGFQDVGVGDFGRCCKDVTVEWQPPRLGPGKS